MLNVDYYQIKNKFREVLIVFKKNRKYQKSIDFLISNLSFQRVIRKIMFEIVNQNVEYRIQTIVLKTLQKAIEIYVIDILKNKHFL